jgi:LAGLIDADG DNA endonuclease family protein
MGTIRRKDPISRLGILRDLTFGSRPLELDPQWIVGFVDGEGCFHVGINPNNEMTARYQVLPEFTVVQHQKDVQVLHALKAYFGCGVVRSNHADRMAYRVRGQQHLLETIIPFFVKHSLKTKKNVDFKKFRRILLLMQAGVHLSSDGVEEIRQIASQMNRGSLMIKSDLSGN